MSNTILQPYNTTLGTYIPWGSVWTPSYSSDQTWTGVTTYVSRYTQIGKTVTLQVRAQGTSSGNATDLRFTAPVTPVDADGTDGNISTACLVIVNSQYEPGICSWDKAANKFLVRRSQNAAYSNTGNNGFSVNISYEVA